MKIQDIPFTKLNTVEIVNKLINGPISVVTAHAEMVYMALNKDDYLMPMLAADIITADGVGLIWGLKLLGENLSKHSGVDIVESILNSKKNTRLFLFGGLEDTARKAADKMISEGANVVGYHPGYYYDKKEVFAEIKRAKAQVVLVGMGGSEKQLMLVNEIRDDLEVSAITVGGVIDLYAGITRRAPKVFQLVGLEWLWRTVLTPKRIVKIPSLVGFTFKVIGEKLR